MNRTGLIVAVVFIAILAIISKAFALSERSKIHIEEGVKYATDAVVVAFSPDIFPLDISTENGAVITGNTAIDNLNSRFGVSEFRQLFPGAEKKGRNRACGILFHNLRFSKRDDSRAGSI